MTIKDHLKSKKHCTRKEAKTSEAGTSAKQASSGKQLTLSTVMKSKDLREGFVLDFVKVCAVANIPLEKTEKLRPFLRKHAQAGALPKEDQLRSIYVPRLFDTHFAALKEILKDKSVIKYYC